MTSPSSETVDFANPTQALIIKAGAGNDTITVSGSQPAFEVQVDGASGTNAILGNVTTDSSGYRHQRRRHHRRHASQQQADLYRERHDGKRSPERPGCV
jgi:hypothetical protein